MSAYENLRAYIAEHGVIHGEVTLSSGLQADYYVDLRRVALAAKAAPLVGEVLLDATSALDFDAVGGLTMGADPVATAMMHAAAAKGRELDAFVVRKEAKKHGMQQQVEGPSIVGRRVLVVDDTSTTGNSPLTAAQAVEAAGATVAGIALIVARSEDVKAKVEAAGYAYVAAYDASDIGI